MAPEAEKSAAASRILGVEKKGQFALSRDNQLRSLAVVACLAVAEHCWMDALDPIDLLKCGVLEPEEVFIKPDMHAAKKVKTKRRRAIWHCSAQAELTTRLLHDGQNKAEISAFQSGMTHSKDYPTFGSCPGMGHHDDGIVGIVEALKRLHSKSLPLSTADASGWDTSVTRSLWLLEGYRRGVLGEQGGLSRAYGKAQLNLSIVLSAHMLSIDGYLYQVHRFGIMSSRNPSTSAIRVGLSC